MDVREAEARLLTERTAAMEQLTSMGADLDAVAAAAAGSNVDDEHDPEGSTIAFEREQLAGLRARVQDRLGDIDAALERLRHGHYGRCERCGNPIGDARLEALPAAPLCVTCADQGGRRR
jgi:RNA polymerase-binding transcription factor DksA